MRLLSYKHRPVCIIETIWCHIFLIILVLSVQTISLVILILSPILRILVTLAGGMWKERCLSDTSLINIRMNIFKYFNCISRAKHWFPKAKCHITSMLIPSISSTEPVNVHSTICQQRDYLKKNEESDKNVLVFIHGFGGSSSSCLLGIEAFDNVAENFDELHAVDLPGFGISPLSPQQQYNLLNKMSCEEITEMYSNVIKMYLEKMGPARISLIGHSFGGYCCIPVCSDPTVRSSHEVHFHGHNKNINIERFVLSNSAGLFPFMGTPNGYKLAVIFKSCIGTMFARALRISNLTGLFCHCFANNDPFWLHYMSLMGDPANHGGKIIKKFIALNIVSSGWNLPLMQDFFSSRVPMAFLHGTKDAITSYAQACTLASPAWADIPCIAVEGAGHSPHLGQVSFSMFGRCMHEALFSAKMVSSDSLDQKLEDYNKIYLHRRDSPSPTLTAMGTF